MVNSAAQEASLKPPNLFLASIALAIAYWIFESCMHAFVWLTGPIDVTLLAQSEAGELEMRLVIVTLLIGSGWFGQRFFQKQIEANQIIARLNRLLSLTSYINQNITRQMDGQTIFEDACRAAVEIGAFQFAWVGIYDKKRKTLEAVAVASNSEACLRDVMAAGLSRHGAHCPMAMAAATGNKPATCLSLTTDDCKAAWRQTMLQHNCNSAAAFPLTDSGSTIGTFVVYAGDEGFFHEQELNLLDEAAGDISYSLTKIKVEEDRKKNEEALRERVEELERHQQASVQREFRIKELKEELETLKGESSNK